MPEDTRHHDPPDVGAGGFDRRTLLKRGAVVGGAAMWTTPLVQTLTAPAWAAGSPLADCGRFTGGGRVDIEGNNQDPKFKGTRRADDGTFGFELHCSPEVVPNNLEVDFFTPQGNTTFHLDTLLSVVCTLADEPAPPTAPVSKYTATATGHTTGAHVGAATISFTLTDSGEPGVDDTVEAVIQHVGGTFTTEGTKPIYGGNIQAHRSTGSKGC